MSLVSAFIDFAERTYSVDWAGIRDCVAARLSLSTSFDKTVYDPRRFPTYWCVPLLVGSYVGATRSVVLADTEAFLSGCIVRHFLFDPDRPFELPAQDDGVRAIVGAYDGCRLGGDADPSFDARFSAKCLPWTVLLAIGTRSILAEVDEPAEYQTAMPAIVLVYSCVQMVDDWHDRREDAARSHWNMWVDEPISRGLSIIGPLLRGSRASLDRLRPHLLRRALDIQLQDAVKDLRDMMSSDELARARSVVPGSASLPPSRLRSLR